MRPRKYQYSLVNKAAKLIGENWKRILIQLATGGGKTVTFAYFLSRYLKAYPYQSIIILVHREELQIQTYKTLAAFGIYNVKVEMIETFVNRAKRQYEHFDVIIVDECHIGNHFKMFDYYNNSTIIGFTATPLSSNRKIPLNSLFQKIIVGISITELIALNKLKSDEGLVPCKLYAPSTTLDVKSIKKTGGEYNMGDQGRELSKPKLVKAVLENYEKLVPGQKGIIFNSTIDHSYLVMDLFLSAGYPCRHLDGTTPKEERKETITWFKKTEGAILCNVGVATTGFDEPTVQFCMINRLTMSLVLWLQMQGRAARPCVEIGKKFFTTIDLCGSWKIHGRWQDDRDWLEIFENPPKPGDGVAPVKFCPNCEAILPMSVQKCHECGHLMPRETTFSDGKVDIVLIEDLLDKAESQGRKPAWALYEAARKVKSPVDFEKKIREWHKSQNKRCYKDNIAYWLNEHKKVQSGEYDKKNRLAITIN